MIVPACGEPNGIVTLAQAKDNMAGRFLCYRCGPGITISMVITAPFRGPAMAIVQHASAFIVVDTVDGIANYANFGPDAKRVAALHRLSGCGWERDIQRATRFASTAEAAQAIRARDLPDYLAKVA